MIHLHREDNFLVRVGATKIMKIWLCMFIDRRQFLPFFQAQKNTTEEKDKSQAERGAIASHDGKLFGLWWPVFMTTKNPWEIRGLQATFYNLSHHPTTVQDHHYTISKTSKTKIPH